MKNDTKDIFSEVNAVLNILGDVYINKLPARLYALIQQNQSDTYRPIYDPNIKLIDLGLKKETIAMLVLFELNYWSESEEEKQIIRANLKRNTEIEHERMREKYSSQNIFKEINEAREKQKLEEHEIHEVAKKVEEEISKDNPETGKGFFGKLFHK